MVLIVERKGKEKTSYYMYDYIYNKEKQRFEKVYVGMTDSTAYNKYLKERRSRGSYCKICGKRYPDTVPEYADKEKFDLCKCFS